MPPAWFRVRGYQSEEGVGYDVVPSRKPTAANSASFGMPHEVFISYSRRDGRVAEALVKALQAKEVSCWIDKKLKRMPGALWQTEISKAIEESKVVVLVYSRNANKSSHVADEINLARQCHLPIIAFRLEDVPLDHGLRLALSRSQWFDAIPPTKRHVQLLVGDVCRILDRAVPPPPGLTVLDRLRVFGHHALALLSGRRSRASVVPHAPLQASTKPASDDVEQHVDPQALVAQGRWYRVKTILDDRVVRGIPLRQLGDLKPELARRLEAFERARVKALSALEHLGPDEGEKHLPRLAGIVADHPDLQMIAERVTGIRSELATLRRSLDGFARQDRWTAAENAIRAFASQSGVATASLLRAAETASSKAGKEGRRLDLLVWTVVIGIVVFGAIWAVQVTVDPARALAGTQQINERVAPELRASLAVVILRIITIPVVGGIGLAFFGTRQSGAGVGFTVMWAIVGVVAEILSLVVRSSGELVPQSVGGWIPVIEAAVIAMVIMSLMKASTSEAVSPEPVFSGFATVLATLAAGSGFLPDSGEFGMARAVGRGIPEAMAAASLLAVSGVITSRRVWLLLPMTSMAIEAANSWVIDAGRPAVTFMGSVGLLFVIGSMASGRRALLGYTWVFIVAILATAAAWLARSLDVGVAALPLAAFSPLLSLWAVACGAVALGKKKELGQLRATDCMSKVLARRVTFTGTKLAEPRLTETAWYKSGRTWHDRQGIGDDDSGASHRSPQRSGK